MKTILPLLARFTLIAVAFKHSTGQTKCRMLKHARDSRLRFDHLPGESAMFLSGYGTRLTPAYLGNWINVSG